MEPHAFAGVVPLFTPIRKPCRNSLSIISVYSSGYPPTRFGVTSAEASCRIHPRLDSRGTLRRRIDLGSFWAQGVGRFKEVSSYEARRIQFVFGGTPLAVLLVAKLRSLEYYQNLPCREILVEVAGIEPASLSPSPEGTTCLVSLLAFTALSPKDRIKNG